MATETDIETETETLFSEDVFVYKPSARSSEGHRASSWTLDSPMVPESFVKVEASDGALSIQLWQRASGKSSLLCQTSVTKEELKQKGINAFCEPVIDSSRYWVLRIVNPRTGAVAYLGMGFGDRSTAFDFKCTLDDRIRFFERHGGDGLGDAGLGSLKLEEGQTIKISIKAKKTTKEPEAASTDASTTATDPSPAPSFGGLRPPPPAAASASSAGSFGLGLRAPPPPAPSASVAAATAAPASTPSATAGASGSLPNDVAAATATAATPTTTTTNNNNNNNTNLNTAPDPFDTLRGDDDDDFGDWGDFA